MLCHSETKLIKSYISTLRGFWTRTPIPVDSFFGLVEMEDNVRLVLIHRQNNFDLLTCNRNVTDVTNKLDFPKLLLLTVYLV